jgi:hypothetical protein
MRRPGAYIVGKRVKKRIIKQTRQYLSMAESKLVAGPGVPRLGSTSEATGTLAFNASRLKEEGLTTAMPLTPARVLEAVRERIAKCRVKVSESGMAVVAHGTADSFRYRNLAQNLRGAWMLQLPKCGQHGEDLKFLVGRTRSTLFLLYDFPPESIYENTKFMGINFRARDILELEGGKTMFLSRVTRKDVMALNAIASSSGGKAGPAKRDTLAPEQDSVADSAELAEKLKRATDVRSEDLLFSIGEFADQIVFSTALQDLSGNPYYYIVSGSEEQAFWLYVNRDPGAPEGALFRTTFIYGTDTCVLYRES